MPKPAFRAWDREKTGACAFDPLASLPAKTAALTRRGGKR